ncbi:hypothetical protein V5F53_08560 [Xanthobacter sp. V4C-4]|uniref:hypothetical protein n=1 Tax=Xanthobacter cornucopiae TaxID=3119924 RepID=UPI0037272C9E
MSRVVNRMMTAFRALALRQGVVVALVLSLVAGPFLNVLNTRHAGEAEAAVSSLLLGFSDPGGVVSDASVMASAMDPAQRGDKPTPVADTSSADHGCHGCAAFVLPVVEASRFEHLVAVRVAGEPLIAAGRTVPTEIRPPLPLI